MSRSGIALSLIFLLLAAAACSPSGKPGNGEPAVQPASENEGKRIASTDVVKAVPMPVEITAGGSGELTLQLTIQNGYHVNANPPTYSYLKATVLEITPADGVSSGTISYPPPRNVKLAFADKPLAVYEGETAIKATLKADKLAHKGERSLAAKLRIQACDDQVCYAPGTLDLAIPLRIK